MAIEYPEDTVNLSLLLAKWRLSEASAADIMQALEEIERNPRTCLPWTSGSVEYEQLMTPWGLLTMDAWGRWYLSSKSISSLILWERYPRLRPYLRSRVQTLIDAKQHEYDLNIANGMFQEELQKTMTELQQQLDLFVQAEQV